VGIALALLQALSIAGRAAHLPVRTYTTADGLPRNTITCIVPDSWGFLWLCTTEGLARFDGYQFHTYGVEQGLPNPVVNTLVQTRTGVLVAGTKAGFAVLRPRPDERSHSRFDVYFPGPSPAEREINSLLEDRAGVLWCGTSAGLFRIRWNGSSPVFEAIVRDTQVVNLAQDRAGNLWVAGFHQGLLEVTPAGDVRRYGKQQGLPYWLIEGRPYVEVNAVAVDGDGTVWAGTYLGLCKLRRKPGVGGNVVERVFTTEIAWYPAVNCLYVSRSGHLWVGARGGASEWTGDSPLPFRHWGGAEGLTDRGVHAFGEDGAGNLWIGTYDEGAKRVARQGFTTYSKADGLARDHTSAYTEARDGGVFAINLSDSFDLNYFNGGRFTAIHLAPSAYIRGTSWGAGTTTLEDCKGDWWVAAADGLFRFDGHGGAAALAHKSPKVVYTTKDGLAENAVFRIFEDSRGDIWVATIGRNSVSRWERASGLLRKPPLIEGYGGMFTTFAEDRGGNVWIGSAVGFFRWRGGRIERLDRTDIPPESAATLFVDHAGSLWLGNRQGLFRCDDPLQECPSVSQDAWREGKLRGRRPLGKNLCLHGTRRGLPGSRDSTLASLYGRRWVGPGRIAVCLSGSARRHVVLPDSKRFAFYTATRYAPLLRTRVHYLGPIFRA
jgi:ligand-binding sensor domain-containing protein